MSIQELCEEVARTRWQRFFLALAAAIIGALIGGIATAACFLSPPSEPHLLLEQLNTRPHLERATQRV